MKIYIICLLFLITAFKLNAINYYLASTGDDNLNSGLSINDPWQTIAKINSLTYQAGDTVFFHAGDIFRGEININQGGNQFARVVFTSYGFGAKPIISGAKVNSNWTQVNSLYQTSITDSVGNFFVSNKEKTLARYPNNDIYLTLDSATTSYLKDQSIISLNPLFIEGNICIHTAQWCWEKSPISSFSNDKINYSSPTQLAAISGYSYFLYNSLNHLDIENEWYYNDITKILYFKSEQNLDPNNLNCESSIYKNGINIFPTVSYVSISNLSFQKQLNAGININTNSNKNIIVDSCDFSNQYNFGVNDKGRYNEISNSNFKEIDGIGVFVNGTGFRSTIHHNNFKNIGQYRNGGIGQQINLSSIKCAFVDSCFVHHNMIDSSGYCGISADGAYNLIERNIIKNVMLLNNDGAALKSYGAQSHHTIFRNNFVSESNGNTIGTQSGNFATPGIYFDFFVNNCIIENNTIYNHSNKGIFQNSGNTNNTIRGNTVYGSNCGLHLNGSPATTTPISSMNIKENVFFALDNQAYLLRMNDFTNTFNFGAIDSNYLFQPYNQSKIALVIDNNGTFDKTFLDWQMTGYDSHSKESFVSWLDPTNESELFMNQSDDVLTIDLQGLTYLDLDSNEVCGSLFLDPYSSKILIKTNVSCTNNLQEKEPNQSSIKIYPNPSSDYITIESQSENLEYQVFDFTGKIIMSGRTLKSNEKLDIQNFPKGIYLFQFSDTEDVFNIKLIKY